MEACKNENVKQKVIRLSQSELWYWFCNIYGIGHKKMSELLMFFDTVVRIYGADASELSMVPSITKRDVENIVESRDAGRIKKEYESLEKKGYRFISIIDAGYPKKLKTLYDPPYGIYVNGTLPKQDVLTIGIVGARNCSLYGKEVAKYFAYHLSQAGVQIVSGLARGIDGYAHEGALTANGYTLGILGCGVDYCYPSENIHLYMKMEKQGGIMSELPIGTRPKAGNFPRRNRLISGMCDGILVVEAKLKSGSLITADQALEQGRDVFAIPGRVNDLLSSGTNNLIKMGAEIVSTPQEILDYYQSASDAILPEKRENPLLELNMTEEQRLVFEKLSLDPKHIDQIASETKLSIPKLMNILVTMELKGYISQSIRNYYTKSM